MTTRALICRIAAEYGGWPHEVAAFPFHYYLAIRNEFIAANRRARSSEDEDDVDWNANSFKGEAT